MRGVQYVQSLIKPAGPVTKNRRLPFGSDKTNLTVTQMLACVDDYNYDGDVDVVVVVDVDVDVLVFVIVFVFVIHFCFCCCCWACN